MEVVYIARVHSTLTEDWPTIPKSSLWASSSPSQISSFVTKWYVQFKKCLFIRTPPNMANFYVKNISRTSIWLKRLKFYVQIMPRRYFSFGRSISYLPMTNAESDRVWFQYPVVIHTYIRSLKIVHYYLLQKVRY